MKPVIGITAPVMNEAKEGTEPVPIMLLNGQYARAIKDAGGLPMILPAHNGISARPEDAGRWSPPPACSKTPGSTAWDGTVWVEKASLSYSEKAARSVSSTRTPV